MNFCRRLTACLLALWVASLGATGTNQPVAGRLVWDRTRDRVEADVRDLPLIPLLERVAAQTGWHVMVEPAPDFRASVKFKDLAPGDALRRLLNDLNYVLVPQSNAAPRLYVFRSVMQNATQTVRPPPSVPKRVPNELLVRLRSGADAEQLAKSLGARITGKIGELNLYRLEFGDADATDSARDSLAQNADVATVDYNYYFEQPQPAQGVLAASTPPLSLQLRPPAETGRVIVGLIDTGVQSLGADLDKFVLKSISVAGDAVLDPSEPSHGTSMLETILRSLQSVGKGSTSVQILPVDVYGSNPNATTWNVANGIVQAVNNGASLINLSLGGGGDSAVLHDVVKAVANRNIPIYAAAGNEPVATAFFPAAYPEVTAVTAVQGGQFANYANYGSFVDVGAPGASVIYYGNQRWVVQGTSAAAAFVSGMAAGLADTTHQTWPQIQSAILKTLPVPTTGGK